MSDNYKDTPFQSKKKLDIEKIRLQLEDTQGVSLANFKKQVPETDDTARIQRAITKLNSTKGNLIFPSGQYVFKNITVPSNTKIIMSHGVEVKSPSVANAGDAFFKIEGTSANYIENVSILGGKYDGENATNRMTSGIVLKYTKNINVQYTRIEKCYLGISINSSIGFNVSENNLYDLTNDNASGYGILVYSSNSGTVKGNYIDKVWQDCILVYQDSKNVIVSENVCKNWNLENDQGRAGIHVYWAKETIVSNNIVYCDDGLVKVRDGIRARDTKDVQIYGNFVHDLTGIGISSAYLSDNVNYDQNFILINDNRITNCLNTGISHVYTGASRTGYAQINSNIITGVRYDYPAAPGVGIACTGKSGVISGNIIKDVDDTAISVSCEISIQIVNNCIEDAGMRSDAPQKSGILLSGTNKAIITNNIFTDKKATKTMVYAVKNPSTSPQIMYHSNFVESGIPNRFDGTLVSNNPPETSISATPKYVGQQAVVSGLVYIATGISAPTDWKQVTN